MPKGHEDFTEKALRHFAALRDGAPGKAPGRDAFPDDWFDLPTGVLADFGAMFYLASMTGYHRPRSLAAAVSTFEPALRLGQYHIFRSGGFPRAFVSWAGLDPARERRFAVDHQPLLPEDWNSGPSIWLVDFVDPFGKLDEMTGMLMRNPALTRLRTLWHDATGKSYRIIEWTRADKDAPVDQQSYTPAKFAARLGKG